MKHCPERLAPHTLTFCSNGVSPDPSQGLHAVILIIECEQIAGYLSRVMHLAAGGDLSVCGVLADVSACRTWDLWKVTEDAGLSGHRGSSDTVFKKDKGYAQQCALQVCLSLSPESPNQVSLEEGGTIT